MNNQPHFSEEYKQKKVYTMEDNVKYISFGIKDLGKQFELLNTILTRLVQSLENR